MRPVYFCDRNLGKQFPEKLRELGIQAEKHDDHFPQATPDEVWIQQVSAKGWVILTLEDRFRYTPVEKAAILHYGARVIVLPSPKSRASGWLIGLAEEFYKAHPKVEHFLRGQAPPFLVKFRINSSKTGRKRYRFDVISL